MSSTCAKCVKTIERRKTSYLTCGGFCGSIFHADCIGLPSDVYKHLKTPGLYWYCEMCSKMKNDYETVIKNNLEDKMKRVMNNVQNLMENMKDEILKLTNEKLSCISAPNVLVDHHKLNNPTDSSKLYSQVVNKSMVIIKPKNIDQPNSQTKSDIMRNLNPVDLQLELSKVKNVSNGGILIGCKSSESANKFNKLAKEKLSGNYEVQELKNLKPKLKIVGMSCPYSEAEFEDFLRHQNPMFSDQSTIKILKFWPTRNNEQVYQAVIGIDAQTYLDVLKVGSLYINYDVCSVYDAIDLKICFKCCGFRHFSRSCTSTTVICPKCSLNHDIKSCPSNSKPKCINCVKAKIQQDDHFVWDSDKCSVYKLKLNQYKSSIFSSSNE